MVEYLIACNADWAAERVEQDPDYFKRLSGLQHPRYLWIGCSDSRVPATSSPVWSRVRSLFTATSPI